MGKDQFAALGYAPGTVEKRPIIHSRYTMNAGKLPPKIAAEILNGRLPHEKITHGYVPKHWGRRLTRMKTSDNTTYLLKTGHDNLPAPVGISAAVEHRQLISSDEFQQAFRDTKGKRIGKARHHIVFEDGSEREAIVDIFRGVPGQVAGVEIIAGQIIVGVHFSSIEEAVVFNAEDSPGRPAWIEDNITENFSTRKLVQYLAGEDDQSEAHLWLQQSASLADLKKRVA